MPTEDHAQASRTRVADLRATWSPRRGDADVDALVERLVEDSTEFAELWTDHEVSAHHPDHKRIRHPAIGVVEVDCEVLAMPAVGQSLVLLSATPGSEDDDKLRLVAMDLEVGAWSRTGRRRR